MRERKRVAQVHLRQLVHLHCTGNETDPIQPNPTDYKWEKIGPNPTQPNTTNNINKKGKGSPYSITERRIPELIPVLALSDSFEFIGAI